MTEIAIIGDRFMLPDAFAAALRQVVGETARMRTLELPWPDEPMVHGYAGSGLDGLKEYQGEPDAIVEFIGEAEILVNHLAPITGAMLDRLPTLKLIAVWRGGPVNIDMAAARARGVKVVNTPGRNASAVAEFTIAAILAETRLIRAGHEALRQGVWRGDLYRADLTGDELSELTVGIIGYGQIGTRVVRLLKPFGCRILVGDPYMELSAEDACRRRGDDRPRHAARRIRRGQPACPGHRGDHGLPRCAAVRADEARRLLHQHRARADGRLRGAPPRAGEPAISAAPCWRLSGRSRRRRTRRCSGSTTSR